MNTNLILGIAAAGFGCFTVFCYVTKNDKMFAKKEAMKKAFGEKAGTIVHFAAYAVVPLVIGIVLIMKGLR